MSADDRRRPVVVFQSHVNREFLRGVFDLLRREYPKSVRDCEHLPDEQSHYLVPHTRRANIDAALRDLVRRFPGISAQAVPNESGEFHVEVTCGPVCLTVSHVDQPSRVVRDARFRRTYAEDNQECLFDYSDRPPPGERLYAIVLHGSNGEWRVLGFADIVFPIPSDEENGICYHRDRIHLVSMFAKKTNDPTSNQGGEPHTRKEPEIG
ncbi:MAG: hypothetical protein NTY65_11040 [Planctomycetota bacterium]|nr:hypothetical protein [Planctomycetota bacterium]